MTRPLRVLMIEDSASDATLVAHALREGGRSVDYERVDTATQVRAALQRAGWDILISNWTLPSFSALLALDLVKTMGIDIPFIVVADSAGADAEGQAMRAGAREFLFKDDLTRLSAAVEREIHATQARDDHRASEASRVRAASNRASDGSGESSLEGRLRRTFQRIAVLASSALVVTMLSFAMSWMWIDPALDEVRQTGVAAADAAAALLDQEAGIRGYLLTRNRLQLEPYARGETALARANRALDVHTAGDPAFAVALAHTRYAEDRWREMWAKRAAVALDAAAVPSLDEGMALFDALRAEQTVFATAVAHRMSELAQRRQLANAIRVAILLAVLTSLLVLLRRQHRALRDAIVAPVAALLRNIGRVRDGELITTLEQSGPRELRQLSAGLNDMVRSLAVARGIAESRDELVREHSNRLRQILDASREFAESLNLSYVVRSVCSSTMAVTGCDQAVVWLMTDDQKGLRDAALAPAVTDTHEAADHALAWRAAKSGRVTFQGPEGRIRFGDAGPEPVRAIVIPLIVGARVVGALEARHTVAHTPSREAIEVLEMIAAHAATAIESARLNQITEHTSQVDPLTKLYNRRRLEEDLEAECKRCTRYGRPLTFVMLDVDHFKAFNDTHGHPQADVALQEVAEVIGGAVRATDTAYRYGGEEFCILLRETGGESAMVFAERLRERVELRFTTGAMAGLTASFGVSEFTVETCTPRSLVEAADAAMYQSKRAGRNQVMRSLPPPVRSADSSGSIAVPGSMRPVSETVSVAPPAIDFRRQHGFSG